MNIAITLPDDVAEKLEQHWSDLPRYILESLVADAYRDGLLSGGQVQSILSIPSRIGVHDFLKRSGVYLNYDEEDLEQDLEAACRIHGS